MIPINYQLISMQLTGAIFVFALAAAQGAPWTNIESLQRARPVSNFSKSGRIVGGSIATRGQIPYQVALILDDFGFFGAGILISDTVVLTAGHCINGIPSLEMWFGAQNILDDDEPGRVVMRADDFHVHEGYDISIFKDDIGIIKLPTPVHSEYIAPVRLPSRAMEAENFVGVTGRLSGWGRFSDGPNATASPDLLFVDAEVRKNEDCAAEFVSSAEFLPTVMCTHNKNGTISVCAGDSGGPFVLFEDDDIPTVIGVISFGNTLDRTCTTPYNTLSGLTRVTSYLDWIATTSGIPVRP